MRVQYGKTKEGSVSKNRKGPTATNATEAPSKISIENCPLDLAMSLTRVISVTR